MSRHLVLIFLVGLYFLVELTVGITANSLSLQTDAFHMLSDLFALIIAYISFRLSQRKKSNGFTYGWTRAEIIGGLINSVFLLAICLSLIIELITKVMELIEDDFQNPKLSENIDLVMIAAGIGLLINLIGLCLFHQDHQHFHAHHHQKDLESGDLAPIDDQLEEIVVNYNNYGVFLHILGDTLGSILVIVSGLIVKFWDSKWRFLADPIVSLLIIVFIAYSSFKLFRACVLILLHQTPVFLDYDRLIFDLKNVSGVDDLHDIHIWPLNNEIIIATLHVKINEKTVLGTDHIIGEIKEVLHQHNIHASTIQPEYRSECLEPECAKNKCLEKQCCGTSKDSNITTRSKN